VDEYEPEGGPYVAVQHCLLARQGMTDESWAVRGVYTPYVLRGVSYRYQVPAGATFPTAASPPWSVYLRITGRDAGPTRVLFRVHYRHSSGRWEHLEQREMDRSIPLPEAGEETHEVLLNLPFLRIGGIGLHAISVHFWYDGVELDDSGRFGSDPSDVPPEWETVPEALFATPDWAFGTVEYFWIERPS
jgi:hypothetical protein